MKVNVIPFSEKHWRRAVRRAIVEDIGDDLLADRIEATIEQGWAKEPPTPDDLDAWAARKIMGWTPPVSGWALKHAAWVKGDTPTVRYDDWQPSTNLGQALECVAAVGFGANISVATDRNFAKAAVYAGSTIQVNRDAELHMYSGAYDEAAIAEAIMRRLHEALT